VPLTTLPAACAVDTSTNVGIIGAGRLAGAIAKRWYLISGKKPVLWSRRHHDAATRSSDDDNALLVQLPAVMRVKTVFCAIPSEGLIELARDYSIVRDFDGALFLTGIDRTLIDVQQIMRSALIVRVAPFLIFGRDDIPSLVLEPAKQTPLWDDTAKPLLERIGANEYVDDERLFEIATHFGSPFAVVLRTALRETIAITFERQDIDARWRSLAERLLWQALSAHRAMQIPSEIHSLEREVATPGGITEAGLEHVSELSRAMVETLSKMIDRVLELCTRNSNYIAN
jgi:pyrroline-5-carboxylate reductase